MLKWIILLDVLTRAASFQPVRAAQPCPQLSVLRPLAAARAAAPVLKRRGKKRPRPAQPPPANEQPAESAAAYYPPPAYEPPEPESAAYYAPPAYEPPEPESAAYYPPPAYEPPDPELASASPQLKPRDQGFVEDADVPDKIELPSFEDYARGPSKPLPPEDFVSKLPGINPGRSPYDDELSSAKSSRVDPDGDGVEGSFDYGGEARALLL